MLGSVLMLSVMAMLIPGALMMKAAIGAEMDAQREAAEKAAFCARHPEIKPPQCDARGPLPGYQCREVDVDAWVCAGNTTTLDDLENATKPPTTPTLV